MVKVKFCSESSEPLGETEKMKAQFETIIEGNSIELVLFYPEPFRNVGNAYTFFEEDYSGMIDKKIFDELKESIVKIVDEKQSKAILVCSSKRFKNLVSTKQIKPNLILEDNNIILNYASIGKDECVLLIALDNEYYKE